MHGKNVVIFEDDQVNCLNPLALTRPAYALLCGMKSLWENIVQRFYTDADVRFVCREYLKEVFEQKVNAKVNDLSGLDNALFINGRILASFSELPAIDGEEEIGIQDGIIIYVRLKGKNIAKISGDFSDDPKDFVGKLNSLDVPKKEISGIKLVKYLWELVLTNGDAIKADFGLYAKPEESKGVIESGAYIRAKVDGNIVVYNAEEATKLVKDGKLPLYVGEGARVYPNVTLDLTGGPIYIGAYCDVRPPSLIDGPCCIMDSAGTSKKTTIIDGGLIRSGCTLGPVCRVGGELEESIIQGYTNKHHAGFIGHAYLGEWVNIGAMATNSDL
ncbi:TPA: hypothetical protein ENX78_15275, partial [Candidatus Poribacteria bacterium]|nr:hypothetical protein [Candidatus Poribacteria bacterium]